LDTFWTVGIIGLALLNLAFLIVVLFLAKEIGGVLTRMGPSMARPAPDGVRVGEALADFNVTTHAGEQLDIGGLSPRQTLIIFMSPRCHVCHDLAPATRTLARSYKTEVRVIVAEVHSSDKENYADVFRNSEVILIKDDLLRQQLGVSGTPYALLLDPNNVVVAKGVVNNLQQLESMFSLETYGVRERHSLGNAGAGVVLVPSGKSQPQP